jgi:hypothetical protein
MFLLYMVVGFSATLACIMLLLTIYYLSWYFVGLFSASARRNGTAGLACAEGFPLGCAGAPAAPGGALPATTRRPQPAA